jgi:hypothetical protein
VEAWGFSPTKSALRETAFRPGIFAVSKTSASAADRTPDAAEEKVESPMDFFRNL